MSDNGLGSLTNLLLPTIVSSIIAIIILGLRKFTATSDDSIKHTVKVENIEVRMTEFERKFEDISRSIDSIWRKLNDVHSAVKLHDYRLDSLDDKERNRDREIGKNKKAPL